MAPQGKRRSGNSRDLWPGVVPNIPELYEEPALGAHAVPRDPRQQNPGAHSIRSHGGRCDMGQHNSATRRDIRKVTFCGSMPHLHFSFCKHTCFGTALSHSIFGGVLFRGIDDTLSSTSKVDTGRRQSLHNATQTYQGTLLIRPAHIFTRTKNAQRLLLLLCCLSCTLPGTKALYPKCAPGGTTFNCFTPKEAPVDPQWMWDVEVLLCLPARFSSLI